MFILQIGSTQTTCNCLHACISYKIAGCTLWFKTVTTTLSKVILANTGQALPGIPGAGSGRISEWKEVPSGGEAPFEFSSGEKQRHKVSSWDGDLLEKCQLNEL